MEKRKVLKSFKDGEDNGKLYGVNGKFPRDDHKPSEKIMKALAKGGFIEGEVAEDKETEISSENTKREIKDYMGAKGIDYASSDTKKDLLSKLDVND